MKALLSLCVSALLFASCRKENVDPALGQGPYLLGSGSAQLVSMLDSATGQETRYQYDGAGRAIQINYGKPGCITCLQMTHLTYSGDSIYWTASDSTKNVWQWGRALVRNKQVINSVLHATVPGRFSYHSTDSTIYFYSADKLVRTETYTHTSDMMPKAYSLHVKSYQFEGDLVTQSAEWSLGIDNGVRSDTTGQMVFSYRYSNQTLAYNPAIDVFPIPGFCALHVPKALIRVEPVSHGDIGMAEPPTPVDYVYTLRGEVPTRVTANWTTRWASIRRAQTFTY